MHIRTTAASLTAAALGAVLLLPHAAAAAPGSTSATTSPAQATAQATAQTTGCPAGYTTEQGTCARPVATVPLTASQRRQLAAKEQSRSARLTATASSVPVRNFSMAEVAGMTIFKEGQGNGKKSWTCGPAATRNMVAAMYKHRDGTYKNISESQFATWEGTTRNGTARANIAATLNNHFSAFGVWRTWRPADRFALLGTIAEDTHDYHQSVILNVDTEYYSFFNGKALNHFDFAYGYDNTKSAKRMVYVGEEWDPIFIYGQSSYGNPYGKHREQLWNVWQAISHTSIHGIVA